MASTSARSSLAQRRGVVGAARRAGGRTGMAAGTRRGAGGGPSLARRSRLVLVRASESGATEAKVGVIFVCLGNICRSPTAEAVFATRVEMAGLEDAFDVDSCGTGGGSSNWYKPGGFSYHEGEQGDPRMRAAASERGIAITSVSRPLREEDFARFQYIVGMDESNLGAIKLAAAEWQVPPPEEGGYKVVSMADYCTKHDVAKVPDPYYAGGFDKVIDLLEDACEGLLGEIQKERGL